MFVSVFRRLSEALEYMAGLTGAEALAAHMLAIDVNDEGAKKWVVLIGGFTDIDHVGLYVSTLSDILKLSTGWDDFKSSELPFYTVTCRTSVFGYADIDAPPEMDITIIRQFAEGVSSGADAMYIYTTSPGHYHIHWSSVYQMPALKQHVIDTAAAHPAIQQYVDVSVYHHGRCIRLPLCNKMGRTVPKTLFSMSNLATEFTWNKVTMINVAHSEVIRPDEAHRDAVAQHVRTSSVVHANVGRYHGTRDLPGGVCPLSRKVHETAGITIANVGGVKICFCFHPDCRAKFPKGRFYGEA